MTNRMMRLRKDDDPLFSQLSRVHDELGRYFGDFLGGTPAAARERWTFSPPLDVQESGEGFTIKTEIPGMNPDDIEMNLTGTTLTLKGEKKDESEDREGNFHRIERTYGSFQRTVQLPETIDAEKVTATAENGVLTIKIGKKEATQPRQIKVQST